MSTLINTWSRLIMAGVVAAGMTHNAAAQEIAQSPDYNPLDNINNDTSILDNIENNIAFYARSLTHAPQPDDAISKRVHVNMLRNSMTALQRSLSAYKDTALEPGKLPDIKVTGVLDRGTAEFLLAIAPEIPLHNLMLPPTPGDTAEDTMTAKGIALLRDTLKTLAPAAYIASLESYTVRIEQQRAFYSDAAEGAIANLFSHCALTFQDQSFTASFIKNEITQVNADHTYVTSLTPDICYNYLNQLSFSFRQMAQLSFLNAVPTVADEKSTWCNREKTVGDKTICLERNL